MARSSAWKSWREGPSRGSVDGYITMSPDTKTKADLRRSLGISQGVAIAVGAVVGVSILALPAMTAREAGPAALLSWLGMALLSVPIVLCIAELAAQRPSAGGVLDYVSAAFGERAGAALGITFLGTIPIEFRLFRS